MREWEKAKKDKELAAKVILEELEKFPQAFNTSSPLGFGIRLTENKREFQIAFHLADESQKDIIKPAIDKLGRSKIHIEITGEAEAQIGMPSNHRYIRPLEIGVSISRCGNSASAGTLGCFVRRRSQPSKLMILSCNHVIAAIDQGCQGDFIIQPASEDGGSETDHIIAQLDSFLPLRPDQDSSVGALLLPENQDRDRNIDAAIARVINVNDVSELNIISNLYSLNGYYNFEEHLETLTADYPVLKRGRTTSLTRGLVDTVNVQSQIRYPHNGRSIQCNFDNLIAIRGIGDEPFSLPGDSGSVIFDEEGYAVALLVGGTPRGGQNNRGFTYGIPIYEVLENLDLDLALD